MPDESKPELKPEPKPETPPPPAEKGQGPDLAKAIEGLLAKHGDAAGAMRVLLNDNHELREKNRDLKAKLPADGVLVLAGDDAKAWADYRQLGLPGDLRKAIGERDQYQAEATGFRKAETAREAAELHGFKPAVLKALAKDLELEIIEGKGKDGKPVREARVKGEGDATTPLVEYAEAQWKDFLPALKAEPAPRFGGSPAPRSTTPPAPNIMPKAPLKPLVR